MWWKELTAVRVGNTQSNISQPRATHTTKSTAYLQNMRIMIVLMPEHKTLNLIKTCWKSFNISPEPRLTYPTPIRYRGFSLGKRSVLRVTIRQKSSFSSPPLRPPMANPGTSRWVISNVGRKQILLRFFNFQHNFHNRGGCLKISLIIILA